MNKEIVVQEEKKRIDIYLKNILPDISRNRIQRLIEEGKITVNNNIITPNYKIKKKDLIRIEGLLKKKTTVLAEPISLDIIYEDNSIVVINKPAGMVVHPAYKNQTGTLVNALLYYFPKLKKQFQLERPGIVHRLDKNTSGVMVVAKTPFSLNFLAKQFANHTVKKIYLAIVKGKISVPKGNIEAPIGINSQKREKRKVTVMKSKTASTFFKVRESFDGYTLVEVYPKTGRTHQIRVHLSHIGFPIVCDETYGTKEHFINRQMLHSWKISFIHPDTKKEIEFAAPIPLDFKKTLERIKKEENE